MFKKMCNYWLILIATNFNIELKEKISYNKTIHSFNFLVVA